MKFERSNVRHPLWRKKVDASLFNYKGTTIPTWACDMWGIQKQFHNCKSKKDSNSEVEIIFKNKKYGGWVTIAKEGRKTPAYRLWFSEDLQYEIKDSYLMSYMRDIEYRLRGDKSVNIESEIPFWEFLDIEYDNKNKRFKFNAYYTQELGFPFLFKSLMGSPIIRDIDEAEIEKESFKILQQTWRPRSYLESEFLPKNVVYMLIDTKNKLLYIGEAKELVKRLKQSHPSIPNWDYYRYNILPASLEKHRKKVERMLIKDYAFLLDNKQSVKFLKISPYKLANDKIV